MASAELQIPEHIQETQNITREELEMILHTQNPLVTEELRRRAQQTAKAIYGNKIYVRGLIEFTNYCKNNCYYCGIRCSNTDADRYRLSLEQILSCCETGWNLGFRTFVLQGGEDPHFTDEHICQNYCHHISQKTPSLYADTVPDLHRHCTDVLLPVQ